MLRKKVFLEILQNSQENTCATVSFFCNFIRKETLAQVFSCEYCEISKNTFSTEHILATASGRNIFRPKLDFQIHTDWYGIKDLFNFYIIILQKFSPQKQ